MKKLFFLFLTPFLLVSCQVDQNSKEKTSNEATDFEIAFHKENAIKFEKLTLYPVLASEEMITKNEPVSSLITLKEAISENRFRITEKKPYGRMEDQGAVNRLTVQNKTDKNIFLMSGDVVQGGRQDRVLAMNKVILPKTITDIDVFCVEKGRWEYRQQESNDPMAAPSSEQDKKILAFKGYYNVASSSIRKSMRHSANQEEVWKQVSQITSANEAQSQTSAYAALEDVDQFIQKRSDYLTAFKSAFDHLDQVVGIVAVSGSEILGTDIFGHPDLFRKQYEALLHSYVTDAISQEKEGNYSEERLSLYAKKIQNSYQNGGKGSNKLVFNGSLVYFSDI